jgi:hypothetical protein
VVAILHRIDGPKINTLAGVEAADNLDVWP